MMFRTSARSYSDKFLAGKTDFDLMKNKNTDWMTLPFTKITYFLFVIGCWGALHVSRLFSAEDCWTVVNIIHGVATFIFFHWIKGCPDEFTQGEWNGDTLYEQIDAGTPWTSTKKFLMLMPTLVAWMACHVADYKPTYCVVNVGMFIICIIAKIPQMHGVRIFGINSSPETDKPFEVRQKQK